MSTTVTTHSTPIRVSVKKGSISGSHASDDAPCDMAAVPSSAHTSMAMPASPMTMTSMSGLLTSHNLVQDEKLVVATLATLDSGNPSNLIKQDLKWIIQSRRKAEGKDELQVEFKKPVKEEQLTMEELNKRARRRELNRLAARRSREKGQKRKDMLVEEIRKLQSENSELSITLISLREQRDQFISTLQHHMRQCPDYQATQNAAVGMSERVLKMLGFPLSSPISEVHATGEISCAASQLQSPLPVIIKEEHCSLYSSCPQSPMVVGLSGKVIQSESTPAKLIGKPVVKIEEPSVQMFNSCSFQDVASDSSSLSLPSSPHHPPFDLSQHLAPKQRKAAQGVEESKTEEEEFLQYKHKLMKHRTYSTTEPPKPATSSTTSSSVMRPTRVTLERSFSFPCASRIETRSSAESPLMSPYPCDSTPLDKTHTYKYYEAPPPPSPSSPSSHTGSKPTIMDIPLNLVVKKELSLESESMDKLYTVSQMELWPPDGFRQMVITRGIERRWSVDEHRQLNPEPLNLSKKTGDDLELSPRGCYSNSPQHSGKPRLKYSGHAVDPFR